MGASQKFMRDKGNPDSAVSARETTPSDPPGRWNGRSRNSRPRHPLILQVTQTDDPRKYLWSFGSLDPSTARNPATPPSDPSGYSNLSKTKSVYLYPLELRVTQTIVDEKSEHATLWSLERSTVKMPPTRPSDPSGHWNGRQWKSRPRAPLILRVTGTFDSDNPAHDSLWSVGSLDRSTAENSGCQLQRLRRPFTGHSTNIST